MLLCCLVAVLAAPFQAPSVALAATRFYPGSTPECNYANSTGTAHTVLTATYDKATSADTVSKDDTSYIQDSSGSGRVCRVSFGTVDLSSVTAYWVWRSTSFAAGSADLLVDGASVGSLSMPAGASQRWSEISYTGSGSGVVELRIKHNGHPYGSSYFQRVWGAYLNGPDAAPTPTPEPTNTPTPEPEPTNTPTPEPEPTSTPVPEPTPIPADPCLDPTGSGDIGDIPGGYGAYLASPLDPGGHDVWSWPGKQMWYGTHMGYDHSPHDKTNDLEVSAAFDGQVRRTNQGYGVVLISTNGKVKDLYNHIIKFYHPDGTNVKAGQALGVLTTYARPDEQWRGIHVHWERASSDGAGGWVHHQQAEVYTVAWLQKKLGASATPAGADYLSLYQTAGAKYGYPWQVLAAIGRVESIHGQNMGPSSAGAEGPMQFMPETWVTYGLDGDGNGTKDVYDPRDAIPAAANYLVLAGGEAKLRDSIYAYNHSEEYVNLVLEWAKKYGYGGAVLDDLSPTSSSGCAAEEDDGGWNPMGWLWDKLRGVLIPDENDWEEIAAALGPVLDKEPIGTMRDVSGFLKGFRTALTPPAGASAPVVTGGGSVPDGIGRALDPFTVSAVFGQFVSVNNMAADAVDSFQVGGVKGTTFLMVVADLVAGFELVAYLRSRVQFAA